MLVVRAVTLKSFTIDIPIDILNPHIQHHSALINVRLLRWLLWIELKWVEYNIVDKWTWKCWLLKACIIPLLIQSWICSNEGRLELSFCLNASFCLRGRNPMETEKGTYLVSWQLFWRAELPFLLSQHFLSDESSLGRITLVTRYNGWFFPYVVALGEVSISLSYPGAQDAFLPEAKGSCADILNEPIYIIDIYEILLTKFDSLLLYT